MKGNINNFLSKTITTYTFLLVIIFILKLVGLDYFGLDTNNKIVNYLANLVSTNLLMNNIVYFIPLIINQYVIVSFSNNDNSKKIKKYNLITLPFYYLFEATKISLYGSFSFLVEIVYYFIISFLYKRKFNKNLIKEFFKIILFMLIVQIISIITRINYSIEYIENPVYNILLNLDYTILLLIIHKIHFTKGDEIICGYQAAQLSSLLKKQHLKTLLKKLQENLHNFKKIPRVERLEIAIYVMLSLLWNVLSLVLVLIVARLNDTFIECIFILTSFWLSKRTFGKPFHFSSMTKCFIVSNLTYYALNRITTPLGISIIVPIMLGVGLSYVTSKFVKEKVTKLYKGMPAEEFNNSILKVTDKDSLQYKICHMFYVERKSELEIAHNVGYSIDNIKKIKSKINKKIKELN